MCEFLVGGGFCPLECHAAVLAAGDGALEVRGGVGEGYAAVVYVVVVLGVGGRIFFFEL